MKVLLSLFALFFWGSALSNQLNNIVVFGDSMSDTGNFYEYMNHKVPQSPPYFAGRFSNGPIWVECLTESYFPTNPKTHLLDYAFGGAGILEEESDVLMSLNRELDIYLNTHQGKAGKDSLYIVWIGANNYLSLPDNMEETVSRVNEGIAVGLKRLAAAGAKYIMVVNIPDLGFEPFATEFDVKKALSKYSARHNEHLLTTVNELQQAYPEVQWIHFDVKSRVDELLQFPERYGFTNIKDTCYSVNIKKPVEKPVLPITAAVKLKGAPDGCEGYLFFDPVHPTAPVHRIVAEYARALLDSEGVEFVR